MYWLLGKESQLSIENKLLLYKAILKSTWTYDIQLKYRDIPKISKHLRIIVNARWYVANEYITISTCHTLETRLKDSADRMEKHFNILAINLMKKIKTT